MPYGKLYRMVSNYSHRAASFGPFNPAALAARGRIKGRVNPTSFMLGTVEPGCNITCRCGDTPSYPCRCVGSSNKSNCGLR